MRDQPASPPSQLALIQRHATVVALEAGKMIKNAISLPKRVETKTSPSDLVTETDKNAEDFIRKSIMAQFPAHSFVGEETDKNRGKVPLGEAWVVDPIDGTTNFVHGYPYNCVSIGFCVDGVPKVGVVYNPNTDQLFSAAVGLGATLNGRPISKSLDHQDDLHKALIVTEAAPAADQVSWKIEACAKLLKYPVHGIRMNGSAALNMCLVALGAADLYFEKGIKSWDIAAGIVIVREAGGFASDFGLEEAFDISKNEIIASASPALAKKFINIIS